MRPLAERDVAGGRTGLPASGRPATGAGASGRADRDLARCAPHARGPAHSEPGCASPDQGSGGGAQGRRTGASPDRPPGAGRGPAHLPDRFRDRVTVPVGRLPARRLIVQGAPSRFPAATLGFGGKCQHPWHRSLSRCASGRGWHLLPDLWQGAPTARWRGQEEVLSILSGPHSHAAPPGRLPESWLGRAFGRRRPRSCVPSHAWQASTVMAGARTLHGCDTLPGSHETAPDQVGSCGAGYRAGA